MQEGCRCRSVGCSRRPPAPPYRDWPLGYLVQTLSGCRAAWLPATREAVELARRLPLPLVSRRLLPCRSRG